MAKKITAATRIPSSSNAKRPEERSGGGPDGVGTAAVAIVSGDLSIILPCGR
jgi:hypothetical protein